MQQPNDITGRLSRLEKKAKWSKAGWMLCALLVLVGWAPLLGAALVIKDDLKVNGAMFVGANANPFAVGDIGVSRTSAPTTGVIYLGSSGGHYLYFNGTNFDLVGGVLNAASGLAAGTASNPLTNMHLYTSSQNPAVVAGSSATQIDTGIVAAASSGGCWATGPPDGTNCNSGTTQCLGGSPAGGANACNYRCRIRSSNSHIILEVLADGTNNCNPHNGTYTFLVAN